MCSKLLRSAALILGLTAALAATAVPPASAGLAASCCISRCFSNRDCDRVCGPGNGVCVAVNSCCRACACLS